jgi:hypothetical protein
MPKEINFEADQGDLDRTPCDHDRCPRRASLAGLVTIDLEPGASMGTCLVPDCPRQNKMS